MSFSIPVACPPSWVVLLCRKAQTHYWTCFPMFVQKMALLSRSWLRQVKMTPWSTTQKEGIHSQSQVSQNENNAEYNRVRSHLWGEMHRTGKRTWTWNGCTASLLTVAAWPVTYFQHFLYSFYLSIFCSFFSLYMHVRVLSTVGWHTCH